TSPTASASLLPSVPVVEGKGKFGICPTAATGRTIKMLDNASARDRFCANALHFIRWMPLLDGRKKHVFTNSLNFMHPRFPLPAPDDVQHLASRFSYICRANY